MTSSFTFRLYNEYKQFVGIEHHSKDSYGSIRIYHQKPGERPHTAEDITLSGFIEHSFKTLVN